MYKERVPNIWAKMRKDCKGTTCKDCEWACDTCEGCVPSEWSNEDILLLVNREMISNLKILAAYPDLSPGEAIHVDGTIEILEKLC